jgi:hypothetical protein
MSDILRPILVILVLTIGLVAYFLAAGALFPERVARTKSVIQSLPGRSFGIGLVNFVFFSVIALVLFSVSERVGSGFVKGILTIPALLIIAFLTMMLSFGMAGTAALLGERLFPDLSTWKQTVRGTICLSLACALPFAGWFLLLPYTGLVGIGAFILGLFQREPKP